MLQTPTVVMTCESPEQMRARAERNGYKNGTKYGSLESQVNYDPRFMGLLKTPSAMDPNSERMKSKGVTGTSGTLAQEMMNGYVEKRGLLLPTPTARDEKNPSSPDGKRIQRKREQGYTIELNDLAAMEGMLPTPSARDWKGKTNPGIVKEGSGCVYGETLPDAVDRIASSKKLLPTPLAVDIQHKRRVDGLLESGSEDMYSRRNGDSRPNGLMDYLHFNGMLPTPQAGEGEHYRNKYTPGSQMGQSLSAMAGSGMLPTPLAGEYRDAAITKANATKGQTDNVSRIVSRIAHGINKDGSPMDGIEPTIQSESAGQTSRLSPLFTEEMMGFPLMWTTFPFLSPSGEPSPSKPTETP